MLLAHSFMLAVEVAVKVVPVVLAVLADKVVPVVVDNITNTMEPCHKLVPEVNFGLWAGG